MKLEAFKYYYIPSKDIGLAGIVAKPTPELLKLQAELIDAVTPFTVQTGDSAAFGMTPDGPTIDPQLIDYVSTFVPNAAGEHFSPHVTTGRDHAGTVQSFGRDLRAAIPGLKTVQPREGGVQVRKYQSLRLK